jgi:amino acid transporter
VGRASIPIAATTLVLALLAGLVGLGNLQQVAAMTDAAVLVAFMFVNASLPWLAARGRTCSSRTGRVTDTLVPALALLLCTWLLLHAGAPSVIAALGLSGLALVAAPGTRVMGKSLLHRWARRS